MKIQNLFNFLFLQNNSIHISRNSLVKIEIYEDVILGKLFKIYHNQIPILELKNWVSKRIEIFSSVYSNETSLIKYY